VPFSNQKDTYVRTYLYVRTYVRTYVHLYVQYMCTYGTNFWASLYVRTYVVRPAADSWTQGYWGPSPQDVALRGLMQALVRIQASMRHCSGDSRGNLAVEAVAVV
jgi:hypothetical protein